MGLGEGAVGMAQIAFTPRSLRSASMDRRMDGPSAALGMLGGSCVRPNSGLESAQIQHTWTGGGGSSLSRAMRSVCRHRRCFTSQPSRTRSPCVGLAAQLGQRLFFHKRLRSLSQD